MLFYSIGFVGLLTSAFARVYTGGDALYSFITAAFALVVTFFGAVVFVPLVGQMPMPPLNPFLIGLSILLGGPFICGWLVGWPIGVVTEKLLDKA